MFRIERISTPLLIAVSFLVAVFILGPDNNANAQALVEDDPELMQIDVVDHLGDTIPLNLSFVNHKGEEVRLEDYFHNDKPVILTLAYYRCPMLCTIVLNGLTETMTKLEGWYPGDKYDVLTISIDPAETPELAEAKRHRYLSNLGDLGKKGDWHFFVGDEPQIKELADALGFKYFYVEERKEFAHPAVVFILTEDGVLSRNLYGLEYSPRDLKLSLLEAGRGDIGSPMDKLILYCFHYDPDEKGYVVFATNVMKIGGLITLIIVGAFLIFLFARYKVRQVSHQPSA